MAQEPIWPGSGSAVSGNTPLDFMTQIRSFNQKLQSLQLGVHKD